MCYRSNVKAVYELCFAFNTQHYVFHLHLFNFLPGVVGAISKLAKDCVLRLTPDMMYFILCESVANGGIHMWCELSQVQCSN